MSTRTLQIPGLTQNRLCPRSHPDGEEWGPVAERPPTKLLPDLAAALGLTTDALLGVAPQNNAAKPERRLARRMQQIEKMNAREKRQVPQLIDAFIERDQLRSAKG